jgi:aminoglycoside 6'-N-acetyltransferase I
MSGQPHLIVQLSHNDSFFNAYCALRIALWPECAQDCVVEANKMLSGSDSGCVFLAVTTGNEAIGFIEVSLRNCAEGASISPVPFIEGWFVESAYRLQGVGRALVQSVEHWAAARGFSEIGSDTQLENTASIVAHERLGYREVERNVCFLKRIGPLTR